MAIDFVTLKLIWWAFCLALFISFALSAGLGLGVAITLPAVAPGDRERNRLAAGVPPPWIGTQIWFILGTGATCLAWPLVSAVAFAGAAELLPLAAFALFLRPLGLDWRGEFADQRWRMAWDAVLFAGGIVTALLLGIAAGNVLQGVPFKFEGFLRTSCPSAFLLRPTPFALVAGLLSLAMFAMHGCAHIQLTASGAVRARALAWTRIASIFTLILFVTAGLWVAMSLPGYRVARIPDTGQLLSPLDKTVVRAAGAWMGNFARYPLMWGAPVAAVVGATFAFTLRDKRLKLATSLSIAGIVLTAGLSMFPFLLPSSIDPSSSLTVWDAVTSRQTLNTLFWVLAVLLPAWVGFSAWMSSDLAAASSRWEPHGAGAAGYRRREPPVPRWREGGCLGSPAVSPEPAGGRSRDQAVQGCAARPERRASHTPYRIFIKRRGNPSDPK